MKAVLASLIMAATGLAACSQQAAYNVAKNAECQNAGGSAVNCSRSHADDFQSMKNQQNKDTAR